MAPSRDDDQDKEPPRGRRGGKTTATPLMVRMTFWIDRDVEEHLRKDAYESGRTQAELVREALRLYYDIE